MIYIVTQKESPLKLYHYGKRGMHWGVVNSEQTSPSKKLIKREVKAQKFDKLAEGATSEKKKIMYEREADRARAGKLSRTQRQVLVGASIVAAYATYKFIDSGEANRLITNGKAAIAGRSGSKWNKNQALSNKDLSADEVLSKIVSRINPDYGKPGTTNNCRRCTFAFIKARQGYDVVATKSLGATGQSNIDLYNITNTTHSKVRGGTLGALHVINTDNEKYDDFLKFVNQEKRDLYTNIPTNKSRTSGRVVSENIFKALSKMPDKSTGELNMLWDVGGGHSMAWEVVKGKPVIFDVQSKVMYDTPDILKEIANRIKDVDYSRLDNVEMDEKILGRWMTNAKR